MALDSLLETSSDTASAGVVAALTVYLEPLAYDARVAVLGNGELGLESRLLELGARTVHLYDPDPERVARIADVMPRNVSVRMLRDDFDVRDEAFDLIVIPDVGLLPDAAASVVRLRRLLDARGAVIAMGRARTSASGDSDDTLFPDLAPATLEYPELYDLFALQFENVTMTGVLPFTGVVFAELGAGDDLTVSVDTRLVDPEPPGVFVVTASRDEEPVLDPYAIVQITRPELELAGRAVTMAVPVAVGVRTNDEAAAAAAAYAAIQLQASMLAQQLDEHRARVVAADQRSSELEGILGAAQQTLAKLESRLLVAEQGLLERDDRIAALDAGAREREQERSGHVAAQVAELMELHGEETSRAEERLRERAGLIAALEKELDRREQLVRELVSSLEDARANNGAPLVFEAAPPPTGVAPEEVARLRRRLDELAVEVARRDGELAAQAWSVTELENEKARIAAELVRARAAPPSSSGPAPSSRSSASSQVDAGNLERELMAARDQLDALRQALTQEHAARMAAESGEELARARAELQQQAALLEQLRG